MILNFTKGVLIGIANIIPGVSGGTFALVLGIYTRLIDSLSCLSFNILLPSKFREEFKRIDGAFLFQVLLGGVAGIALLAGLMDYLLKFYPEYTLSFFAGLILVSISIPYRMIESKEIKNIIYMLPGLLLVAAVYRFWHIGHNSQISLVLVFISAALGISAMVLPGLSGSFVLLIMGVYEPVVGHIKDFFSLPPSLNSFKFLVVFGLGCVAGLVLFVRIMKYLLHRKRNQTLSFLTGLVAGSFIVLWPFKDYPRAIDGAIDISIITAENIIPSDMRLIIFCLMLFTAGAAAGAGLKMLEKT